MSKMFGNSRRWRRTNEHWPTPDENTAALVIGLRRAGIELPARVLDPCAGEGKLARALVRLVPGVLVAETDFFPYPNNPGLSPGLLDARNIMHLDVALCVTGAQAILTNPPYTPAVHSRIVVSCLSLLKAGAIDLLALFHQSTHLTTYRAHETMTLESSFTLRVDCAWRTVLVEGSDGNGMHTHSWRVWTRQSGRAPGDPYPTISVSYPEAAGACRRPA
jgi:hypothetical protein